MTNELLENNLSYISPEHQDFYEKNKSADGTDVYRDSLVYLVGLSEDTRIRFDQILTDQGINPEILDEEWITGGAFRTLTLAFNLYNGYTYGLDQHNLEDKRLNDLSKEELIKEIENGKKNSVENLFGYGHGYYYLQAINLRFSLSKGERNRKALEKMQERFF
ncbi:DUF6075 family protein [Candidatus Enterococcus courvalinii]|uniref:Uncharacterized protein n=1 Tax=Candidatus Enterococcus courvalinii TaxID=2815329 RepID=A0ABS3HYJ4_9ENTE|nr:DUF6075 family protein [Enterococcus sp. MSG2901]MBO0481539.1 hypothetical protein [Enterococcus sp. MSG2901]